MSRQAKHQALEWELSYVYFTLMTSIPQIFPFIPTILTEADQIVKSASVNRSVIHMVTSGSTVTIWLPGRAHMVTGADRPYTVWRAVKTNLKRQFEP
jgi:hypothetical protein